MKYTVDSYIFEKIPHVRFGIIIGSDLHNSETTEDDHEALKKEEENLRKAIPKDQLKEYPNYHAYREALKAFDINPNKYMNSIEAMTKRILKGSSLPRINALVDCLNTIALRNKISLGGHDLRDIKSDLEVRLSKKEDVFLPFGQTDFESIPENELVFISGKEVQTRHWLWRQSELGKMTLDSKDIFFQVVGFDDSLEKTLKETEEMIACRFGGQFRSFIVDKDNRSIEF